MKQTFGFLTLLLTFALSLQVNAQNNIQRYLDKLGQDSLFRNSATAVKVMDSQGNTVAAWNPEMPLLTASTMKTITTGLALVVLGEDYQFSTKLGYSGFVDNGTLYGDLYIIGGGDPTLGSPDSLGMPADSLFGIWQQSLQLAGIDRINGHIIADDRYFEHEIVPSSWAWSNLGPSYGSGPSGLSFYENLTDFKIVPGKNIGDDIHIKEIYPAVPGMTYINKLTTGGMRTGRRYNYRTSDISKTGVLSGTISNDYDSTTLTLSNKFPHLSCASEFKKYLDRQGIYSRNEIIEASGFNSPQTSELTIVHETLSKPLKYIVNVTNRISNNFYAETLFKMIGKKVTGTASYDSAAVAAKRVLKEIGVPLTGYTQEDGSGLSRQNYVSPQFFCNFYSAMTMTPVFESFFTSLPFPGQEGTTFENVLKEEKQSKKEAIHAKSGSLANVRCYAGYVEKRGGRHLYFAILSNNFSARTSEMQVGIEEFMKELIKY
jgi:D-alanyl-D-alanine carboxypeptidase/D-alanyl-D-alanine-endopeptidase (penicillin-binding protein 4)